jgi:hypothetical protein
MNKILPLSILSITLLLSIKVQSQETPIGYSDANFGLGVSNTNTTSYYQSTSYSGEGIAGHVHTSLIADLTNIEKKHRVVLGDYLGSDLFLGAWERRPVSNADGYSATPSSNGVYWGGSIEFGIQGLVRIVDNVDIGAKLYYSANVDNTRFIGNTGEDDNQVIKIQGRYKRFMGEYGFKTNHLLFFKSTRESPTQAYHSFCFKYILDMKQKTHIGIKIDKYSDVFPPNAYVIGTSGFSSYNVRIFYGIMF